MLLNKFFFTLFAMSFNSLRKRKKKTVYKNQRFLHSAYIFSKHFYHLKSLQIMGLAW